MNPRVGLILRLLGPLIEIACLVGLKQLGDRRPTVAGLPVEYLLYAGLAVGLVMVIIGLTCVRPPSRRPGDPG